MTTVTKKAFADELEAELIAARDAYHTDGTSPLSDEEYDRKLLLLKPLRPDSELFTRVGAPVKNGVLIKHAHPVGSQEKLKSFEEVEAWDKKIPAPTVGVGMKYVLQWKLDGITIVLTYSAGELVHAVTRGDGYEGEDVTRNVLYMQNVKKTLKAPFTGSLRGELMLPISAFEQYFEPLGFKNPRNTAAGKTRDLKADPKLLKHFTVTYFDCSPSPDTVSELNKLAYIESELGLDVVETTTAKDAQGIWDMYECMAKGRNINDFETDGVVIKVNSLLVQDEMGMTSDLRPKGQKCLKFTASSCITGIVDVVHTVGHTGEIFPTAKVVPTDVNGVTVSSCTLHNYEEVKRLGVAIGDTVRLIRAGDVIPKITELVQKGKHRKPILPPTECPACGVPTVTEGQHVFCRAEDCPGQEIRLVKTWVRKREIKWLGDEIIEALYEKGVHTPRELYDLTLDQLDGLELNGRRVGAAAVRIFKEIKKSTEATLPEFIGSLGLNGLGRREAELMMSACDLETVDDFLALTEERLAAANGYGEVSAKQIVAALKKGKPLIKRMLEVINIRDEVEEKPVVATKTTKASGKTFCFTGALPSGATRDEATADLHAAGGIAWDSVKKGLDYLVIADPASTSSKAQKARTLGVTLISEDQFRKLLK